MTIPSGSNYPESFDTERNLYTVHDVLRLRLAEDYSLADTSITCEGDPDIFARFPDTGFITLTEQCSDIEDRALTFFYNSKASINENLFTFSGLELEERFTDVPKPKTITNVTQNVMDRHHNAIKDAIIAIEEFVGVKGTTDLVPFGSTMEGRTNFLHRLVLQPRAWFTADKTIGLIPLEVVFTEQAFQIGENCPVAPVEYTWNFGDQDCSVVSVASFISNISVIPPGECPSTITVASVVPVRDVNVNVIDEDGGALKKTYSKPGIYDVTLTVKNKFGEDTVVFPDFITALFPAPDEATISVTPRTGQIYTEDPLYVRSPVDTFIDMTVPEGRKPGSADPRAPKGRTYAGEILNSQKVPIDPIISWSWELSDDLAHEDSRSARASYSVGGLYDIILRVDTQDSAYRITQVENAIDIVENVNLWLWIETNNNVTASEFGLISETFKTGSRSLKLVRNSDFLTGQLNSEQLIREFNRNTFFAPNSTTPSGERGESMLYWAGGRAKTQGKGQEEIKVRRYNGFTDTYVSPSVNPNFDRPWNWAAFNLSSNSYFILGNVRDEIIPPNTSPTNQEVVAQDLTTLALSSVTFTAANYLNGADELMQNVATYDGSGDPVYGHFSVYRTASKNNTGYLARNDGVGPFFRIKSFYKTQGTLLNPVQTITKLPDIAGTTKLEGQLVPLTSGIFFFNNSATISAYNDTTSAWETGGASSDSVAFSSLQDTSVEGFNDLDNTLLAASDGDRRAYLSYDYSPNAFIKFNQADLTFSSLGSRPIGTQWMMSVY
jgi:PKD repeat protein